MIPYSHFDSFTFVLVTADIAESNDGSWKLRMDKISVKDGLLAQFPGTDILYCTDTPSLTHTYTPICPYTLAETFFSTHAYLLLTNSHTTIFLYRKT